MDESLVIENSGFDEKDNQKQKKKFKQPFNYMVIRFIAILIFAISQGALIVTLYIIVGALENTLSGGEFDGFNETTVNLLNFMYNLSRVSLSLVYVTIFSLIFKNREKIKRYVLFTFCLFVAVYLILTLTYNLIIKDIIYDLCYELCSTGTNAVESTLFLSDYCCGIVEGVLSNVNVFLDTFVCTVIFLFIFYEPKKIKNIKLFRSLVSIPILYVCISLLLLLFENLGYYEMNFYVRSLLVSRKASCYLFFIAVCVFVKIYQRKNDNKLPSSFTFSLATSIILIAISDIDYHLGQIPNSDMLGIGNSVWLFLGIPFVFLYDYQKNYKFKFTPVIWGASYFVIIAVCGILYYTLAIWAIETVKPVIGPIMDVIIEIIKAINT